MLKIVNVKLTVIFAEYSGLIRGQVNGRLRLHAITGSKDALTRSKKSYKLVDNWKKRIWKISAETKRQYGVTAGTRKYT